MPLCCTALKYWIAHQNFRGTISCRQIMLMNVGKHSRVLS